MASVRPKPAVRGHPFPDRRRDLLYVGSARGHPFPDRQRRRQLLLVTGILCGRATAATRSPYLVSDGGAHLPPAALPLPPMAAAAGTMPSWTASRGLFYRWLGPPLADPDDFLDPV